MERRLRSLSLDDPRALDVIREAKRLGFSDRQIAICLGLDEIEVRRLRKKNGVTPVVKQIDTLAAEWPAVTNYLYLTYGGWEDDIAFDHGKKKVMTLGSGVFRIGSSVEFDWCGVNTILALKRNGIDEAIMVNYNPETVSTDYDISDRLYFEELTLERVLDIYEKENPLGVIVGVGGQIPNNIALKLASQGVRILGTQAESIDRAEDRSKFSALLDELGIPQPKWSKLKTMEEAEAFAEEIGYPVLIRPSYVLSGSAMRVAYTKEELREYLQLAAKVSQEYPVVISKFIEGAKEAEVDGVSDGYDVIMQVIEHVEKAGVHSGDATMSIPPRTLSSKVVKKIQDYAEKIVKALKIKGLFNIQFIVKGETVYVIECNLRASRSMPYTCKTTGVNMVELATQAMLGKRFRDLKINGLPPLPHYGVKAPQFSFMRLSGADPILGVEMVSTGEVACLGENFTDALMKALQSAEFRMPSPGGGVLITVGGEELKRKIIPLAKALEKMGYKIYATEHTAVALKEAGIEGVRVLHKVGEFGKRPNILDYLVNGKIDFVINIPKITSNPTSIIDDEYTIRRLAVEYNIPVVTTLELASALVNVLEHRRKVKPTIRSLNEYMDSLLWKYW